MKSANIILLNPRGEFLLQLRDNKLGVDYPGYWGLIGGVGEKGETPLQTIKREIKEEIGCKVSNINFLFETHLNPNVLYTFQGEIKKEVKDIDLTEGQKIQYFKFKEIKELHLIPMVKKLILEEKWKQ